LTRAKKLIFIIFSIIFLIFTVKLNSYLQTNQDKKTKNKLDNELSIKLKECFDLDNKNQRNIQDSMKLIEFCVVKYGID
tara:strand:- start:848 stop:1084 length:237 start_codon:yes stop_codon:yes gene_type:complete